MRLARVPIAAAVIVTMPAISCPKVDYVEAKTLAEWKMNIGEYLFVLPGNNVPADVQFGDLPFKELDAHFFENLGIAYRVDQINGKRIKLVWENLGNNESYLVDLTGALVKE